METAWLILSNCRINGMRVPAGNFLIRDSSLLDFITYFSMSWLFSTPIKLKYHVYNFCLFIYLCNLLVSVIDMSIAKKFLVRRHATTSDLEASIPSVGMKKKRSFRSGFKFLWYSRKFKCTESVKSRLIMFQGKRVKKKCRESSRHSLQNFWRMDNKDMQLLIVSNQPSSFIKGPRWQYWVHEYVSKTSSYLVFNEFQIRVVTLVPGKSDDLNEGNLVDYSWNRPLMTQVFGYNADADSSSVRVNLLSGHSPFEK